MGLTSIEAKKSKVAAAAGDMFGLIASATAVDTGTPRSAAKISFASTEFVKKLIKSAPASGFCPCDDKEKNIDGLR